MSRTKCHLCEFLTIPCLPCSAKGSCWSRCQHRAGSQRRETSRTQLWLSRKMMTSRPACQMVETVKTWRPVIIPFNPLLHNPIGWLTLKLPRHAKALVEKPVLERWWIQTGKTVTWVELIFPKSHYLVISKACEKLPKWKNRVSGTLLNKMQNVTSSLGCPGNTD